MGYFALGIWTMLVLGTWLWVIGSETDDDAIWVVMIITFLLLITTFFIGVHIGELGFFIS